MCPPQSIKLVRASQVPYAYSPTPITKDLSKYPMQDASVMEMANLCVEMRCALGDVFQQPPNPSKSAALSRAQLPGSMRMLSSCVIIAASSARVRHLKAALRRGRMR